MKWSRKGYGLARGVLQEEVLVILPQSQAMSPRVAAHDPCHQDVGEQ